VPQAEVGSVVRPLPKLGVGVLAERDGKIAMGLRRYKGGNIWSLPGGKVDPFESVLRCGQRELAEETGLVVDELQVFIVYEFIEQEENYHFISFGVVSHSNSGERTNLEPGYLLHGTGLTSAPFPRLYSRHPTTCWRPIGPH
jgi:8-oxo-dGTP diphosphatase